MRGYVWLAVLTCLCLAPFSGKAFHVDDPLFVWTAQHIVEHPTNPYGFPVAWYDTLLPMADVTKNPPLAAYFIAAVGALAGWSERALHLAFLLPAVLVVVGTYRLARRFTKSPILAAAATLLTPGFLVSATSVMCDTMMLAFWIWAAILWLDGIEKDRPVLLAGSAVLTAACILTKYYGIALMPLLAAYAVAKQRRAGAWLLYLSIPVLAVAGYEWWSQIMYGNGLLAEAVTYKTLRGMMPVLRTVTTLSFVGGCAVTAITFIPMLWSRRQIVMGGLAACGTVLLCAIKLIDVPEVKNVGSPVWLYAQLAVFVAGGIALLALVWSDLRRHRDAESWFLGLWAAGTFGFAAYLNWSVNARSVLPLIPAAAILAIRRLEFVEAGRATSARVVMPLLIAGVLSIWVVSGDVAVANADREAASSFAAKFGQGTQVRFTGHWGFQYYMQSLGFQPVDFHPFHGGGVIVVPENTSNGMAGAIPVGDVVDSQIVTLDIDVGVTTVHTAVGAGFYADVFGPLPYAFGAIPPERYAVLRMRQ